MKDERRNTLCLSFSFCRGRHMHMGRKNEKQKILDKE